MASMFDALQASAGFHNAALDSRSSAPAAANSEDEDDDDDDFGFSKGSRFLLQRIEQQLTDELRLELSDRIRKQELTAFVEIPSQVDQLDENGQLPEVTFYSEESGLSATKSWLDRTINEQVRNKRLARLGIDANIVQQASTPVNVRGVGLLEQDADGAIQPAVEKDEMAAIFLPFGVMMLMFMVILMSAQPVLESVLEEKSQRIAEVLLGSANPSQLMAGKLLGTVAGSLTVFAIYLAGGCFVATNQGYGDMVPLGLVPWFVAFQMLGVMFYASIFMSVASSVSQLKEAQSVLLPVWMLVMSPLFRLVVRGAGTEQRDCHRHVVLPTGHADHDDAAHGHRSHDPHLAAHPGHRAARRRHDRLRLHCRSHLPRGHSLAG